MDSEVKIVLILTFGFVLASIFGFLAKKLKLPTLLGFLLAGFCIGPSSPGFVADTKIAEQLAEIGVILMLFSVGLHFKLSDLSKVKKIAIPGAIIQTTIATLITLCLAHYMGWPIQSGIILGLTIGVASTFVMAKTLADHRLLDTKQGHIAVGWLVVEDIFTIMALVILPLITIPSTSLLISSILIVFAKFILLCLLVFTLGYKIVTFILTKIAQTRSQELFTLTVLAFVFLIATVSSVIFGASLALGAFIAGMLVGQTSVKYQASIQSLSLKHIFTIIFFLSVGMLLDPLAIKNNFSFFLGVMGIILFVKPLAAFVLVLAYRLPIKFALTVAFALAQIGEFSFILADQANLLNLLPQDGYDIIIGASIVSICLNPLLFRLIEPLENFLHKFPPFSHIHKLRISPEGNHSFQNTKAIIIGYGPIGQESAKLLKKLSYSLTVLEHNINTVTENNANIRIFYGDASFPELLQEADVENTKLLVITSSEIKILKNIILSARELNPHIKILAKILYLHDIPLMETLKVHYICSEQETSNAFFEALLSIDASGY